MWRMLHRLGHAVEERARMRLELRRLARLGHAVPAWLPRRALRRPAAAEDALDLLRFVTPERPVFLIDGGANRGDWLADFLDLFPDTRAVAVEPVPATHARLAARFAADPRVATVACALSDRAEDVVMRLDGDDTLASLHAYHRRFAEARGLGEAAATVTVPARRLDEIDLSGRDGRQVVLKLDVQGHEAAALAGAAGTLESVDVALVEVSFVEEYVGQPPSFAACTELLRRAGLHPAVFQDFGRAPGPYAVERDVLYVRQPLLARLAGW